jgi:ATP/maltotriose-dependent transcriptional regulator MalT
MSKQWRRARRCSSAGPAADGLGADQAPYRHAHRPSLSSTRRRRSAQLELESARELFAELGAIPELRDVESLLESAGPAAGRLSGREIEVLRLVATDMTNHAIQAVRQ